MLPVKSLVKFSGWADYSQTTKMLWLGIACTTVLNASVSAQTTSVGTGICQQEVSSATGVLASKTPGGDCQVVFNYNGTDGSDGSQTTWVVPAYTSMSFRIRGGAGYGADPFYDRDNGKPDLLEGTITGLTVGQNAYVTIGGRGAQQQSSPFNPVALGGYNGGGTGYPPATGGGGATDLRYGGSGSVDRILVAAAGGGNGLFADILLDRNASGATGGRSYCLDPGRFAFPPDERAYEGSNGQDAAEGGAGGSAEECGAGGGAGYAGGAAGSGNNWLGARGSSYAGTGVTIESSSLYSSWDHGQLVITYTPVFPQVTDVTSSIADGHYRSGDQIPIQIKFSETVNVTGTPTLLLETGATDRSITYSSGDGTDTLTFTYTVLDGDTSADLDYASTSALSLSGGAIVSATYDTVDADLTLPALGASGSLGANKAIVIDTTAPVVSDGAISLSKGSGANGAFVVKDTITVSWDVSGADGDVNLSSTLGSVTFDFSEFGGESMVPATLTGTLWEASYPIDVESTIEGSNLNVSLIATDAAGNFATATDTSNARVVLPLPVPLLSAWSIVFLSLFLSAVGLLKMRHRVLQ